MDNQKLLLYIAFAFITVVMYQTWQMDYGPKPAPITQAPATAQQPGVISSGGKDIPTAMATAPTVGDSADVPGQQAQLASGGQIHVVTDVYDITLDSKGGDIRRVLLPQYPVSISQPDVPFELLSSEPTNLFIAQSGIVGDNAPDHHAQFSSDRSEYRLEAGKESLEVKLTWQGANGVMVDKIYTFYRGRYDIDFKQVIRNGGDTLWNGRPYQQLQRGEPQTDTGNKFIYTYTGGVIYSQEEKYEKYDFSDMTDDNLSRDIRGGWAAMIQHYFVGAWIPSQTETHHYYSTALGNARYTLGAVSPSIQVAGGQSREATAKLFIGPKLQDKMQAVSEGLELTVDYGVLTVIAQPIFWLLNKIQSVVSNWGWSIILLTVLIKLVFYKLSETSYKSMANMRKMGPKMKQIKERYGDDKQRLNQAMMEIYKKEKINPLGGCLPILVQIPVFISLYWVLLESVDLRQAEFMFWIVDLSTKDPYFVLPVIMGVSMFVQQKLNPTPPDPIQAKIMMMLPIVFTFFFLFFPAGLVLYWVVNNLLSIAQQWVITRRVEQGGKA